jgi:hypothetical protein
MDVLQRLSTIEQVMSTKLDASAVSSDDGDICLQRWPHLETVATWSFVANI